MANLKEIRNRIASINSTMQITGAMKMVSASKSKKAQDAILAMKPYSNKLKQMMQLLGSSLGGENPYMPRVEDAKNVLIVAISSDRGLCGAFNSNVSKSAISLMEEYESKGCHVVFQTIGKKVNDVLKKTGKVNVYHQDFFDNMDFAKVADLAQVMMKDYREGVYDKIVFVYNSFKNVATQFVLQENFLPIEVAKAEGEIQDDYIFEPSKEEIVEALIPKALKMQFYKVLRDSLAAEHGARMTAMHKATDNATELRDKLNLTYNKARQSAITNEIIEIVSGAQALG